LVVGLLAGLLFPLVHYGLRAGLRLQDSASVVALGLVSGPLSLIGLVLLADGRWGHGWNGVGAPVEGVTAGVGIGNVFSVGTGQLAAQLFGLGALGLWGLLWGGLLGLAARSGLVGQRFAGGLLASPVGAAEGEPDDGALPTPATGDHAEAGASSDGEDTTTVAGSVTSSSDQTGDDAQASPSRDTPGEPS
jgi:hypothetical protein